MQALSQRFGSLPWQYSRLRVHLDLANGYVRRYAFWKVLDT